MITTARTVGDAMLRRPTVHPVELSVADARAAFVRSPKTHLLLVVWDGRLISSVTRADLAGEADAGVPAARVGLLAGRTVSHELPLAAVHAAMVRLGQRRLAVVDDRSQRLLGLLCLKRSLTGFCSDDGVDAMRRARTT